MMVLPIWEGSGNIIILDMLRALAKSEGFKAIATEITKSAAKSAEYGPFLKEELNKIIAFGEKLRQLPQDEMEATARIFFEQLTTIYQVSLLIDALDETSSAWISPTLKHLTDKYKGTGLETVKPLSVAEVDGLIGWKF
jgi:acyl-CoA dehydrogenase